MTESAFIALHLNGVINFNNRININYDTTDSLEAAGETTGTITGVTVTPESLPGVGNTVEGENIEDVLQGITQLSFNTSLGNSPTIQITLQVEPGVYYPNINGNEFYYFRVTPYVIPLDVTLLPNPEMSNNTLVIFSPYLQDLIFGYSQHNPLVSNAELARTSKTLLESDRFKGTVLPSNYNAILADTATPADVQDSNYYNTGWTNSRYEGSKSTPSNYGGVLPSITGRGFIGERFDDDSTAEQVCYADNRVLEEFFHTGISLIPSMSIQPIGPTLNTALGTTQTTFTYSVGVGVVLSSNIDKGDLLEIGTEIMKVTKHLPNTNTVFVKRGYFSIATGHSNGAQIKKLDNISVFELKDNTTNLEVLNDSKIFIKKNSSIIYTDEEGLAYSQSFCDLDLVSLD